MDKSPKDKTATNVYDRIATAARRAEASMINCDGTNHEECRQADEELEMYLGYLGFVPIRDYTWKLEGLLRETREKEEAEIRKDVEEYEAKRTD